ncbi:hypothetical protein P7C70_g83, partial [Phenoliferia sp. Uapishka_3]
MPTAKKWVIICVISSASFAVTCCSSMVAQTYQGVEAEFGVSNEVATLGLSLFVLGLGFAPLVLGPLSEFYGRSPIYISSYFFFICSNILVAFSPNISETIPRGAHESIGIGIVGGVLSHPIWARYYRKVTESTGARPPPEEHLRKGLYAAVLLPASLFWFAWTTQPSIHWSVSMVATVPFGVGLIWSFQAVFVYLVDAFRPVAASAMAANSALRSSFAAGFPLFTHQMFSRLGTQWALTLCAFLCLAMTPFPFLFFKYGSKYRKGSKFSNTS